MSYEIRDHKLIGNLVQQVDSTPKSNELFTAGLPDTIVIHFTGGSSLESSVRHLCSTDVKASAHLVIGRDGQVRQLVNFDRVAWHAGVSEWKGRKGLNRYSIGIELDNAGRMTKAGQSFISWFGRRYEADQVIEAKHRNESFLSYWHAYCEEQLEACFAVCRLLSSTYAIGTIVGHEEISPGRKVDPGPAFPLEKLRDQILVGRAEIPETSNVQSTHTEIPRKAIVKTELLNIRQLPYIGASLAGSPLLNGTEVEIVEKSEKWYKVCTKSLGWVHSDFLQIKS